MPYNRSLIYVLGCLALYACNQKSHNLSREVRASIVQEVEKGFKNYFAAVRRGGLTAELDYLDDSADFFWVPPGYDQPISYDSVVAVLNSSAERYRLIENIMDSLHVVPLSLDLASYSARIRSTMHDTAGQTTTLHLVESGIVVRRNETWKLLSGQTTVINR
jgi:hypothetical protein